MKLKVKKPPFLTVFVSATVLTMLSAGYFSLVAYRRFRNFESYTNKVEQELQALKKDFEIKSNDLKQTSVELEILKNEDQYLINQNLADEIKNIKSTYGGSVSTYEDLIKLKESSGNTEKLDALFTDALTYLADENYSSAATSLAQLDKLIKEEEAKIAASFKIPESVPASNAPPGTGYSVQKVSTDSGTFMVNIVAADLGSTRVIVDTASEGTCTNDCPILPLSTYVSRNGAYAGVNGSYYCPATYPSCAGKTNSFDTLLMNKNKAYFNSDNNIYSNNPAVIFGGGYIRFVTAVSQWGRDTSIDSMISNFPLLVFNGQVHFSGNNDSKMSIRSSRGFVASKGNTVYIGVVRGVTVAESAKALHALGMDNALNLDGGGSTALWYSGYKAGPGRNLASSILFARK